MFENPLDRDCGCKMTPISKSILGDVYTIEICKAHDNDSIESRKRWDEFKKYLMAPYN